MVSEKAREITAKIYRAYGSHTGYLFGLRPTERCVIEIIVQLVLELTEKGGENSGEGKPVQERADEG